MKARHARPWAPAFVLALVASAVSTAPLLAQAATRALIALTLSTGSVLICEVRQEERDYIKVYDLKRGEEVRYPKAPNYRRFVPNEPRPKNGGLPKNRDGVAE